MAALVFRHTCRVTYAQCTVGNHVYYSCYLELLEAARGEFFRRLGTPLLEWQQRDTIFPVVECRLRYRAPARYDDILTIEVWPAAARGARLNFGHLVLDADAQPVLVAETFHVCAGLNEKPKRLPADLIARLEPFLRPDRRLPGASAVP